MFGLLGVRGSNFFSLLVCFVGRRRTQKQWALKIELKGCFKEGKWDLESERYENGSGVSSGTHDLPREKG